MTNFFPQRLFFFWKYENEIMYIMKKALESIVVCTSTSVRLLIKLYNTPVDKVQIRELENEISPPSL